ncbi:phage tail protein [Dyella jiangningensis]|uniref:Microcystin-dependent protein n=1 Tax=Dyella jiangningensis TaxID=1379159 RepID=A0A328NWQ6_9GAMM|nr:tail fiber protein [Dyella jiangningensis]RAO74757.1 microcystin-dependent protein [Dyella jiangningensis]
MSDPFLGEIQIYGFNFAPNQWAMCQGQLMPIQQNTALFSLLGTTYGGNGTSNYQLPNFNGNAACGQGLGVGLSERVLGETFGTETVTLLSTEMPAHTHGARVYNQTEATKRTGIPGTGNSLTVPQTTGPFTNTSAVNTAFAPQTIGITGASQPHPNQQPYLSLNFCIALAGAFPQRP